MDQEQLMDLLEKLGSMISATFGSCCEVAISCLDAPEPSILYLFNGHVTGRSAGEPLDEWAKARISSSAEGCLVNYHKFRNNKDLKASTVTFEAFGHHYSLCINYDITALQMIQSFVGQMVEVNAPEPFTSDNPLEDAIDAALRTVGKPAVMLSKEERLRVLTLLDQQGILQMQKSIATVAKVLGVSRYTVYNYLGELGIKPAKGAEKQPEA